MTSILEEALKEVGYVEKPTNLTKFAAEAGHPNGFSWCATFIVAMARRAHVHLPNESAYTPTMAQGFKAAGLWDKIPRVGSIAFYDFPDSTDRIQHVGIVESVDHVRGTIRAVEGNTSPGKAGSQVNGGGVYLRTRPLKYVVGFGHLAPTYQASTALPAPHITVTGDDVRRIDLAIDIDNNGHGYRDIDAKALDVVSVVANTANPPQSGYKPIPDVARLDVNGKARIVVEEGLPGGRIDVSVWVLA